MSRFPDRLPLMPRNDADWIWSAGGRKIWPFAVQPDEVMLLDLACGMAYQGRFYGQVNGFYSIAEHCVRGAQQILRCLSMGVGPDEIDGPEVNISSDPQVYRLAYAFLLHEGGEVYFGDAARPVKYAFGMEVYRAGEHRATEVVWDAFGVAEEDRRDPILKLVDRKMYRTEERDLQPPKPPREDGSSRTPTPFIETIDPWAPDDARRAFVQTYRELAAKLGNPALPSTEGL